MLQIYNTATGTKEIFQPITPGEVRLYVCGMTVYDYCHLGHGRVIVAFDVIVRYLRYLGYKVTYIRNITDIDDKIIKRAADNNEKVQELTSRMIAAANEDFAQLQVIPPDKEPKATNYIEQIISMIADLIKKGFAYVVSTGDVYYRVSKFSRYGQLSGKVPNELRAGARVEVNEQKEDALDFVLWKAAKAREPGWDSPWGQGRPGWHIECSAMCKSCLGSHLDIHGGGPDLKFPHHENEIAQSEIANDHKFVNTWIHVGPVRVEQEKMSKSLNNFITLRTLFKKHSPEVVRFLLFSSHYRSPINFTESALQEASLRLKRIYRTLHRIKPAKQPCHKLLAQFKKAFKAVMDDDFNTPKALALLFTLVRESNVAFTKDPDKAAQISSVLKYLGAQLGILYSEPEEFLKQGVAMDSTYIETMIAKRDMAKKVGNYTLADSIRQELLDQGITLQDSRRGTNWVIQD